MLARFCKKDLAFTWSSHRPGTRTIRCCSPYCSCHQHSQHNCAEIQRYNKCFHKVPEDIGATMFNITIVLSVLISECRVAFRLTEEIQGSACSIVFQCWQMLARFCKKDLAFTWSSHRPGTRTIRCCSPYCSCHQHSQHNCAEIQRYNKCFHKVPEDIGATMFKITTVLSILISECRVAFRLTEEIQGSACSIVFQCWQMLARFCKKDLAFTWSSHRPGTRTIRCCSPYCSCH